MFRIILPPLHIIKKHYGLDIEPDPFYGVWTDLIEKFEEDNQGRDCLFDDNLGWTKRNLDYLNQENKILSFILLFILLRENKKLPNRE